MSLHRVLAPPPLALAVHPAPAPKTREELRKEDEERRAKREKGKEQAKEKEKAAAEAKVKAEADAKAGRDDAAPAAPPPGSPPSDAAEPPTPKPGQTAPANDASPPIQPKEASPNDVQQKEDEAKNANATSPAKPLPPLRLLPPVPYHPLRSRTDLNPARPYPPIYTDPRGAYHRYAKAVQGEVLYVDVTKDGWLVQQWKERSEREAVARLTGEVDKQRLREVAKAKAAKIVRRLPETAEGLLLELWNDLVEAPANEISVEAFWARYDWSEPTAKRHLQIMPEEDKKKAREIMKEKHEKELKAEEEARLAARAQREKEKREELERREREKKGEKDAAKADGKEGEGPQEGATKQSEEANKPAEPAPAAPEQVKNGDEADKAETADAKEADAPAYQYPEPVEWTREGVEEILATVGLQCAYNTEKPLPRHWTSPSGGFLLLAHDHFLLRIENDIEFKPEGTSDKFEALVTTANDRVFGEMVVAQMNAERRKKEREYKERKEREYRERKKEKEKEKNKEEAKENDNDKEKVRDKEEKAEKGDEAADNLAEIKKDAKTSRDKAVYKAEQKNAAKPALVVLPAADMVVADPEGTLVPPTPALSNIKLKDGEPVKEAEPDQKRPSGEAVVDKVIIAVPVKDKAATQMQNKDEKHEQEPMLVAPAAKVGQKEGDQPKDVDKKRAEEKKAADKHRHAHPPREKAPGPLDAGFDAEMLIKMFGPEAANNPLADLKMAFAAMEAAAAKNKARNQALGNKKDGPLIWAWHEPCERWRWRNFAAGCAEIGEGAWEERDWKVFADDRGVEEFENDMSWEESLETDIHDWSC